MRNGGLRAADGEGTAATAPWLSGQVVSDAQSSAVSTTPRREPDGAAHVVVDPAPTVPSDAVRTGWRRAYLAKLIVLDLLAVGTATVLGYVGRFGLPVTGPAASPNMIFSVLLPVVWVAAVALNGGYEGRFVGVGTTEFQRIFRTFLHITVLTAFVAFATKTELARGFLLLVLPLTLLLDLGVRYLARKRLHARRAAGLSLSSVLAVGGADAVAEFTEMLRRDQYAGMRVVGSCVPSVEAEEVDTTVLTELGVPVLGDVDSVRDSMRRCGADTVAVLSGEISAEKLRWISWQLEGTDTDLVVSPGLTEVGGRRLHVQPVAGLPLLHIDEPEFTGMRRVAKAAFDRSFAGLALLVLAPVFLALALAVKLDSRGPAFFRQERVGLRGRSFRVFKFRSMCADAEQQLVRLQDRNDHDGVLFKIRDDPRVTRVGRFIRRYSLDELPQLLNVVRGEMSLVGPRPPLPSEVAQYGDAVRRRLLVKPGITGLWQVSGRSDLSWDESVRLDLRYVENWSFTTDLMILWKTVFTVIRGAGAY
jgi:exopolysaccharide biosynthesis polyprenyl glycosylphosphotransferase